MFHILKTCDFFVSRLLLYRHQPSQADITILGVLKGAPTSATPNVLRWYKHIQSYKPDEQKKFAKKSLSSDVSKIISSGDRAAAPADDDDVDLFGSDDEEVCACTFFVFV